MGTSGAGQTSQRFPDEGTSALNPALTGVRWIVRTISGRLIDRLFHPIEDVYLPTEGDCVRHED